MSAHNEAIVQTVIVNKNERIIGIYPLYSGQNRIFMNGNQNLKTSFICFFYTEKDRIYNGFPIIIASVSYLQFGYLHLKKIE